MTKVDFRAVRREIAAAAPRAFAAVRAANAEETFYAFALYSDDGAMTVCPAANTVEGEARCRARCPTDESHRKFLATYGMTIEDEHAAQRWLTAEWSYEGEGSDYFGRVSELIGDAAISDDGSEDDFVEYKAGLFAAMVLGLADAVQEGGFGTGPARDAVTVFCSVSDSSCSLWLELESAKRLNPPHLYQAYLKDVMRNAIAKTGLAELRRDPGEVYRAFRRQLSALRA
jgi:hypothetical protein